MSQSQRQLSRVKNILPRDTYSCKKEHYIKKGARLRCACCDYIKKGRFHTSKTIGDIFYHKEGMACESSNSIYVIICSTCNEEYIEQTGKQGFKIVFQFIGNTSVNCNISYYNVRNTFEFVEKENLKYSHSSHYIQTMNA